MIGRREFLKLACVSPLGLLKDNNPTIQTIPVDKLLDYGIEVEKYVISQLEFFMAIYGQGQLGVVHITKDYCVLDNQITVMAAVKLGWKTIRCKVLPCKQDWSIDPNVLIARYS